MSESFMSYAPALGLLLLLVLLAWGVQWMKKRTSPSGSGLGADLRLVAHLPLGPQQRVVVVEVNGPNGPVQLTLGVTPQHVRTLHTQNLGSGGLRTAASPAVAPLPAASYKAVAEAVQASSGSAS